MTLASDLITDLDVFFDDDEFAKEATLPTGVKIKVIVDSSYQELLNVENARTLITGKASDLTSIVQGSTIILDSVSYSVKEKHPEGDGITVLELTK